MGNWSKQSQNGFISLFILIPLIVAVTVVATLTVPKVIEKNRILEEKLNESKDSTEPDKKSRS